MNLLCDWLYTFVCVFGCAMCMCVIGYVICVCEYGSAYRGGKQSRRIKQATSAILQCKRFKLYYKNATFSTFKCIFKVHTWISILYYEWRMAVRFLYALCARLNILSTYLNLLWMQYLLENNHIEVNSKRAAGKNVFSLFR